MSSSPTDCPADWEGGGDGEPPVAFAELRGVTKSFGGTLALQDVSFALRPGEVLALLGENGAGKSTCVKLLAGVHRPDEGRIFLEGQPVYLRSPLDAQRCGVAVMHQHPGLFPDLSVAENIFMGHAPKDRWGRLDHAGMSGEASRLTRMVGLLVNPTEPLGRLRTSEQQLVEIAKALAVKARVLIMDEPTAALSQREVDRLFRVIHDLRQRRVAIMFVSHRMEEIYRMADRIAVLRDGRLVATARTGQMPHDRAVRLMVGRPLASLYPSLGNELGKIVLSVERLSRAGAFEDVSFSVRAGEILGFAGLVGSGRTEIARVLFGIDRATSGTIRLLDRVASPRSPGEAMKAGIAYVSEDRLGQSLIMDFTVLANASLAVIGQATRLGFLQTQREIRLVKPYLDRLRLRFHSFEQPVNTLSGGNQQKVVLSKWLATVPQVIIFDEPTQGVDVQTKAEVHAVIAELARQGIAIILISSELPELVGMCHRMIVLREGRVTAELDRDQATQERIAYAAIGTAGDQEPSSGRADPNRAADLGGPTALSASSPQGGRRPWRRELLRSVIQRRELGLVAAIAAVVLPVFMINPRMLSGPNLVALSMDAALLSIVAAAQMLVVITRNIDLSVASVIGLAAYMSAASFRGHPDLNTAIALAMGCGIGLVCGILNGAVVTVGRVPAIVVTLGTLALYRGLDSLLAGGKQISAGQVSQAWLDLTGRSVAGIPGVVLIAVGVLSVLGFVLRFSSPGRELFAIGSNPDGARLIGIRVQRRVCGAFAFAGLLAGFDGALWASRYATIDARVASGFELTVIAAVVIGGVAIRGGSGTILGVALGGLTLLVIRNGLMLVRVDPLWLQGVYGLVILIAITVDAFVMRRSYRRAAGRSAR
ncbi:MAG: ATP-binding cassette domain-containing protein [Verrucomicrobia bacterium]|nr:ATP-binding cassette domain-containing protein [Verrucomicrobiota bacterium]